MNDSSLSSESTISPDEADAADESFITVRSLWKVFGKNPERALGPEYADRNRAAIQEELGCLVALRDVSFDVPKGQTFVVMGLSGSGKSTLVRCLTRLIEPTAGTVEVGSEDVTGMSDNELTEFRRKSVAMVFQHYGLMPHRNVLDNAAWGLEVRGASKKDRHARSREVLELVGLRDWEDAYPSQLSGGMQQRVGLARALVVDPDILLMDEPFSGLDPLIRRQMQDELLRLQAEMQKTIVFITHDLNEALKLGDRIAIMHDGQVAQIGSPEDIVLRPADEYVGEFTQDVRLESVLTASTRSWLLPRLLCWATRVRGLHCTPLGRATATPPGWWILMSSTSGCSPSPARRRRFEPASGGSIRHGSTLTGTTPLSLLKPRLTSLFQPLWPAISPFRLSTATTPWWAKCIEARWPRPSRRLPR